MGALTIAGAVYAQDAGSDQPSQDSAKKLETITVTGSRIRSVDVETAQPVISLSQADIQKTGLTNVGDILQNLTITGQPTFSKAAVLTSNTEEGGQYVNLYNLGENRTLVLVNGKRWMTSLNGYTDVSTIPAALIDRIEILKDGASSIYGSDAVAGVVNIILKDHVNGASVSGSIGQNQGGDGTQQAYSFTVGNTTEKSSLVFAATYNKTSTVWAKDRDITRYTYGPYEESAGYSGTGPWGRFTYNGKTYVLNHTGDPNNIGVGADATQLSNYHVGVQPNDYFNATNQMMEQLPTELKSIFTEGSYKLSDNVTFKANGMYAERDSSTQVAGYPLKSTSQPNFPVYISGQSYYNPVPGTDLSFVRRITELPRVTSESAKSLHFDAGFEGDFEFLDHPWNWDAGFDYNKYDVDSTGTGNINLLNLQKALGPSFLNSQGVVQCGTAANPIALSQCVPFNILGGPSASTKAALNYIMAREQSTSQSISKDFSANITGGLFELPAGTFSFAAGVEHRNANGYDTPDELASAGYTTDLAAGATVGSYTTNEAYVELNAPLLKDLPGAKSLDLDVASRYSHYSNFGSTTNNKYSFTYSPIEDLMLRGTFAKGFRAPTLGDLFGGGSQTFDNYTDPCDAKYGSLSNPTVAKNCAAAGLPANFRQTDTAGNAVQGPNQQSTTPFVTGAGNQYLQPEHSTTRTLGLVYSPHYVDGLDMTLDYYDIKITNVITAIDANYVLDQCYQYSVQEFCSAFQRDANGQVVNLHRGNANLGWLETTGYNLGVNYRLPAFSFGKFVFNMNVNYLDDWNQASTDGAPAINYAGQYGLPHWRANLGLDWTLGKWGATWGIRYYGAFLDQCWDETTHCNMPNYTSVNWGYGTGANRNGAIVFNDAQVRYQLPWKAQVSFGMRDIFNKKPPNTISAYTGGYNSSGSIDPTLDLGRYIYLQYNQQF
ncbi:TonB-dependent siderophore receptor [Dyella sp. C9]|uniref:TonB-dependent receptor plug domain-containing protein n=1 Tax=Dyella sp. C9 TaxID=2202154 RepID=UPI0018E4E195|nr:TonB-dependent receptor [Dyella sp. C9]